MMCDRAVPTENVTEAIKQIHYLFWDEMQTIKRKGQSYRDVVLLVENFSSQQKKQLHANANYFTLKDLYLV